MGLYAVAKKITRSDHITFFKKYLMADGLSRQVTTTVIYWPRPYNYYNLLFRKLLNVGKKVKYLSKYLRLILTTMYTEKSWYIHWSPLILKLGTDPRYSSCPTYSFVLYFWRKCFMSLVARHWKHSGVLIYILPEDTYVNLL